MADKPNVLFILSDQHNAKYIGCKGMTDVITPNLDRMATEGVLFDNALSQTPICTPNRIILLSGQYAHNSGRFGFGGEEPPQPTVFEHFRKFGYHTASLGKMHCPGYWLQKGCDEFYETDRTSAGGSCKEYLDYQAERGINIYDEYSGGIADKGDSPFAYEDSQEGWMARKTVDVMKRASDAGKPFFVHMSLTKPHQPYKPAQQFWDMYDDEKISMPPNADYDMDAAGKAPHLIDVAKSTKSGENWQEHRLRKLHGYLGNVTHCDFAIGEVLAFLDEAGLADDTIIVYSADHGEYACEHGPGEKVPGIASDAVTRVPMIWRWGKRFASGGKFAPEIAESVDVATTLCSLTGVEPMDTADGKDLTPILEGKRGEVRTIGVSEFVFSHAVRKGKHRMVFYPTNMFASRFPGRFGELYDLEADPWEMKNLYFDPKYKDLINEIHGDLLDWIFTTSRPVTAYSPSERGADGKLTTQSLLPYMENAPYL